MPKGSGIAIGLAIGVAMGTALDNIAVGIALGVALGVAFDARHYARGGNENNPTNESRSDEKQANMAKLFAEIQMRGEMTNDEVEKFLGVSDATAERYLQELESTGTIVQVGETGKSVKYRKA